MKVILWTGNEPQVGELRAAIREKGHVCMIRNAGGFQSSSDAEACDAIAFHQAANQDQILAAYRSEGYVSRRGHVQLIDLELGAHGEPVKVPDLPPPPPAAKTQADYLDDRLDNMDYDSLRAFVKGVTGEEPPPAANEHPDDEDRAALIALVRQARPSAAPVVESPPAAAPNVEAAADTETAPDKALENTPPPPPANEGGSGKGRRTR